VRTRRVRPCRPSRSVVPRVDLPNARATCLNPPAQRLARRPSPDRQYHLRLEPLGLRRIAENRVVGRDQVRHGHRRLTQRRESIGQHRPTESPSDSATAAALKATWCAGPDDDAMHIRVQRGSSCSARRAGSATCAKNCSQSVPATARAVNPSSATGAEGSRSGTFRCTGLRRGETRPLERVDHGLTQRRSSGSEASGNGNS
jgi:hypothetical protein